MSALQSQHKHTPGKVAYDRLREAAPHVPNGQPSGGSGRLHGTILRDARRLQRKGLTLSEIAEELDCRRSSVERMLYWEVVGK